MDNGTSFNASAEATDIVHLGAHNFFITLSFTLYATSLPLISFACAYGLRMQSLSPVIRLYILSATLNVFAHLYGNGMSFAYVRAAGKKQSAFFVVLVCNSKTPIFVFKVQNNPLLASLYRFLSP